MSETEPTDELVSMSGEIIDMTKKFSADGWGFGKLKAEGQKEPVKITGTLEGFSVGQCVSLTGYWRTTTRYGTQLAVETILADDPQDLKGIKRWIMDRLPQVGPVRAEEIAKKYGATLWHVIESDPMELTSVNGITAQRAEEIAARYREYKKEQELFVPYYSFGMTRREARKAMKYGVKPEELKTDPFLLYLDIPETFSFRRVNHLANRAGCPRLSPTRLMAAAVNAVQEASNDGHTAVGEDYLLEHASAEANISTEQARAGLALALLDGCLVREVFGDEDLISLRDLTQAEAAIAIKLGRLLKDEPHDGTDPGPDAGGSSSDAPVETDGDRDWAAWQREDHDPQDGPGETAGPVGGSPGSTDGESGEADR